MSKPYISKLGDTFSSISRTETGSEKNAQLIRQANPHVAAPIAAGETIEIPGGESTRGFKPYGLDVKIDGVSVGVYDSFTYSGAVDGFSRVEFNIPNEPETRKIAPMLEPIAVDFGYNGTPVFSGYMEAPKPTATSDKKTLAISANSWPNLLLSPPSISIFPFEMENAKLDLIAKNLIDPFSIGQVFQADPGPNFRKVSIKQSGNVGTFLSGLCKQRARVMRDDEFGSVVFDSGEIIGAPVLRVDDMNQPGIVVTPIVNPSEWYSHIFSVLKSKNKKKKKKLMWKNPFYSGIMRTHEFEISESDEGELQTALNSVAARMFARVFALTVTIPRWTDANTEVFKVGTGIEIKSPANYVDDFTEFLISGVTLNSQPNKKIATLTCVTPGAYAGIIPEAIPWKSAR